ncbi:hypothetical protein JW911_03400 [Candidatus Peregrinibacteria bacterium]|nr:hypothetical protein [Candidatus Peregrinibacteria bacterium]
MRQALRFYALILAVFLFLVINVQNIPSIYQQVIKETLAADILEGYNHSAALTEEVYASALDGLDITLHPGTAYDKSSQSDARSLNHCKALVFKTLASVPSSHSANVKNLTLYFADGRRGLGGGSTVILRCSNIADNELISVLVHEIGHTVDTGKHTGTLSAGKSEFMDGPNPVYNDDISLRFYRISWKNESTLKNDAKILDFVTGYAKTDPFEDFAETYNFYLLHGAQFKELAKYNVQLKRKYLYMKYYIFAGKEYDNDPYNQIQYLTRYYDSTKLSYDADKFVSV